MTTLTTIADLEALPEGTTICVGGTIQERTQSRWTKQADGTFRYGDDSSFTLAAQGFEPDLNRARVVHADDSIPQMGQVWRQDGGRQHVIIRECTAEEGAGHWWALRVTTTGEPRDVLRINNPGNRVSPDPGWARPMHSAGVRMLEFHKDLERMTAERDEAQRAQRQVDVRVRQAESTVKAQISLALGNHLSALPYTNPVWGALRTLNITARRTVPVHVQVTGEAYVPVTSEALKALMPEGVGVTDTTRIRVPFSHVIVIDVDSTDGRCVCGGYSYSTLDNLIREQIGEPAEVAVANRWCGSGAYHQWVPEGVEVPPPFAAHGYEVGQRINTREEFEGLPVGTVVKNSANSEWIKVDVTAYCVPSQVDLPPNRQRRLNLFEYNNERWEVVSLPAMPDPFGVVPYTVDRTRASYFPFPQGTTVEVLTNVVYSGGGGHRLVVAPPGVTGGWLLDQRQLSQVQIDSQVGLLEAYDGRSAYWLSDRVLREMGLLPAE